MHPYVKKLQNKPHHIRKQIRVGWTALFMAFVFIVWIFSLHQRFSSPSVAIQTQSDIKPFALFGNSIKSTVSDISASAANAPSLNPSSGTASNPAPSGKMIPLTQVQSGQ